MHAPKPVNWEAAKQALSNGDGVEGAMAALLGCEGKTGFDLVAAVQDALAEQRDPDITIHARHCGAFVFRGANATDKQAYESLRDVAERALPDDPPMHEINGRLRRELDESEVRHRDEVHALRTEIGDWRALAHQAEAKLREVRKQMEDWQAEASTPREFSAQNLANGASALDRAASAEERVRELELELAQLKSTTAGMAAEIERLRGGTGLL